MALYEVARLMYVNNDILKEIGKPIPKTWDEREAHARDLARGVLFVAAIVGLELHPRLRDRLADLLEMSLLTYMTASDFVKGHDRSRFPYCGKVLCRSSSCRCRPGWPWLSRSCAVLVRPEVDDHNRLFM